MIVGKIKKGRFFVISLESKLSIKNELNIPNQNGEEISIIGIQFLLNLSNQQVQSLYKIQEITNKIKLKEFKLYFGNGTVITNKNKDQ